VVIRLLSHTASRLFGLNSACRALPLACMLSIGWALAGESARAQAAPTAATAAASVSAIADSTTAPSPPGGQLQTTRVQQRQGGTAAVPGQGSALYPGDVVRLKIFREPDLSGDYDVNAQGIAVFPKVGSISVIDIGADSLQRLLVNTYSKYLVDPAIEVIPLRRVTVLGAVKNPGLYPVDPTLTVAHVIALAGGATSDGNQKKLELIRGGQKLKVELTTRDTVATTPIRSGDEIYVPERSWLVRNGYVIGAAIGATGFIVTAIINH